jgi:transcriptional regulator with XRE-family HTH domain
MSQSIFPDRFVPSILSATETPRSLPERLGEPQSFVSKFESGERRLDIVELRYICGALGVPLPDLVARYEKKLADSAR